MNKKLYIAALALSVSLTNVMAQTVGGIVKDASGEPLAGVKITEVGLRSNSTLTDENGVFALALEGGEYIDVNYADKAQQRVMVTDESVTIVLDNTRDAVRNLGLMNRTAETQTQATSLVTSELLGKSATMNPQNALYGLISGLDARQNVGWKESASLNIRGRGGFSDGEPLILVDGFERSIDNISLDDIESVQVLKDGASTALYGARGANGVINVTTKRGIYNALEVDVNYKRGFDFAINEPQMADAYNYALARNEALFYDGITTPYYSDTDLDALKAGNNTQLHPNVNWADEALRDYGENNQFNIVMRGGGNRLRYFAAIDYRNQFGLLSDDYTNYAERYNSQIRSYDLGLRMNLDVDVTKSTIFRVNMAASINEDKTPNANAIDAKGINTLFTNLYRVPAAAFPIRTENNYWGSNTLYKINPLAEIVDEGFIQDNSRSMTADMRIIQDLSVVTKGLSAEVAIAYDNWANFRDIGKKSYDYEVLSVDNWGDTTSEVFGTNSSLEISSSELHDQMIRIAVEGKIGYERSFGAHQVSAAAIYRQDSEEPLARNASYYRQNILGYAGYNYDNRYIVDVVANYYGTSVLLEGERFNTYPAVSAAWNLSNESFMEDVEAIDLLKVRASWGLSAVDRIGYGYGDYFWTSGNKYSYGNSNTSINGLKEGRLPIAELKLETAEKTNIGVDFNFLKNFSFSADVYKDHRTNILVNDNKVSSMVGVLLPKRNVGEAESQGVELSLGYHKVAKDYSYYVNANWAYNDSRIIENGEKFQPYDYLYRSGSKIGQLYGLEADGYFDSFEEIADSPKQTFSDDVRPGDIKYVDQNNDKKIDSEDVIAIGKSTSIPEFVFALNLGFEYKGFGVDALFQGISGISALLDEASVHHPLRNDTRNISKWYLEDNVRWTNDTKDTANLPRLSTLSNENNYQTSTQWLTDASFLKLRNLNVYYNFPQEMTRKINLEGLQVYARGQNLFSLDKVDNFNVEDIALGYSDILSLYVGLNIKF